MYRYKEDSDELFIKVDCPDGVIGCDQDNTELVINDNGSWIIVDENQSIARDINPGDTDYPSSGVTPNDRVVAVAESRFRGPPLLSFFFVEVNPVPVELKDINDHDSTSDDVTITPWDKTQNITENNIAWIDAHTSAQDSAQDSAPRMPQLEFRIPGLEQGVTLEAKLEVQYNRGNGTRTERNQSEDRVRIPSSGAYTQVTGDTWQIWHSYQTAIFFGGDATLTYRLMKNTDEVLSPQTINFRIGGRNPDEARCKAYIQAQPNAGINGTMSFMYAIAKHETKAQNRDSLYYNQFYKLPIHKKDVGRPVWGNDGPNLPGGYGIFQVSGTASDHLANVSREQIWNWQENVKAAFVIISHNIKSGLASRFYVDIKDDSAAHLEAFNECPPPNITSSGRTFTSDIAIWITAYNGWGGLIRNRYIFSPTNPCGLGVTQRWYWNPPIKSSGKTYLELVAEEIE